MRLQRSTTTARQEREARQVAEAKAELLSNAKARRSISPARKLRDDRLMAQAHAELALQAQEKRPAASGVVVQPARRLSRDERIMAEARAAVAAKEVCCPYEYATSPNIVTDCMLL